MIVLASRKVLRSNSFGRRVAVYAERWMIRGIDTPTAVSLPLGATADGMPVGGYR